MAPLLAMASMSTFLSAGIHMLAQAVRYNLLSSALFQHVDLVTTILRAGFQVYLS